MLESRELSDDDLREIFARFSSCEGEEIAQIYRPSHRRYFKNERLQDEYTLVEGKREFALDSWRAATSFLKRHGYAITKPE